MAISAVLLIMLQGSKLSVIWIMPKLGAFFYKNLTVGKTCFCDTMNSISEWLLSGRKRS